MPSTLHITNGDAAIGGIRESGAPGDILAWRDVLHDGPVPSGLSLDELSRLRAAYLESEGVGTGKPLQREFAERDKMLRRYSGYDEVILWFEWDLYDQLQLIQLLDFFSKEMKAAPGAREVTLSIVCIEGYLGCLPVEQFADLYSRRRPVSQEMLSLGQSAWAAFRANNPREMEQVIAGDTSALEFLGAALRRGLEELPSTFNGLSRSESQILEEIAAGSSTFSKIFGGISRREERVYCGDGSAARYIERMSLCPAPLLTDPSGESIVAPANEEDFHVFRDAEFALTPAGLAVLAGDRDWIDMSGSARWLGGIHLDGSQARWRWDAAHARVVDTLEGFPA
ncbi:MAG TPA: hypothetical protein VHM24_09060 [Gemmatimonadaceae bacterium]|nr:hypothetical protein [Gemmatimonadaceae bacterium]